MTQLRWVASSSASALYAAAALARGQTLLDPRLAATFAPAAAKLAGALGTAVQGVDAWGYLVPLSGGIESNRDLAAVVARKLADRGRADELVGHLAPLIGEVESTFRDSFPQAADELEVRSAPLREQWEARGPGLLAEIGKRTSVELLPDRADVLLVHPVLGGGGDAFLTYNTVAIEAVLANPINQVPEVVRLGWLISMLQLDLPRYSESVPGHRLARVAGLAMLPAALSAGEYVELARDDQATMRQALVAWRIGETDDEAAVDSLAATVCNWWQTYTASPKSWNVALMALDRLLNPAQ